jgi:hypothetical protein
MQAQNRFARFSTRPIALGAAALVGLALTLFALVLITGALRSVQSAATGTEVVIAHQQAPDAQERNAAYLRVLGSQNPNETACVWISGHKAC